MEEKDKEQQRQQEQEEQLSANSTEPNAADQPESPDEGPQEEQQAADSQEDAATDQPEEQQEPLEAGPSIPPERDSGQVADNEEMAAPDLPEDSDESAQEEQQATDPSIPPERDSGQAADNEDQEQPALESAGQDAEEQEEQPEHHGQEGQLAANGAEETAADQPEDPDDNAQQEQPAADPSTPRPGSLRQDSGQAGQAGQVADNEEMAAPDLPEGSDESAQEEQQAGDPEQQEQPSVENEEQSATEPSDAPSEEADPETSHPCHGSAEDSSDGVRTALVSIRGQNRTAHFNAGEHSLVVGDEVVIQTEQGKNIGVVREPPVTLACRGCKNLKILRKANPEELARDEENRELEKKAFDYCTKTIEEWEIPMRLVQVEFLLDRSKAVFFFTAEKRVDFRELVRTLAREFSTRIEMRQIGIRDEARLLGGLGPCGMAFCCSTFLKEFAPISVKMAKEQNVILNPNKISGGCGRLLCCLNYEYDMYKEASKGVPKVGKKVNLPEGTGKIRSVDIFARTVTIDLPEEKKNIVMDIDELLEKLK
jgi:cell fate regulator YaaT (PSP1 superfamily)